MTKRGEIYKCHTCENVVDITREGMGTLVCCGQDMENMTEHEAQKENAHYAHLENIDETRKKVTFNHEMTPRHHFEYIEIISNDNKFIKRKYLEETEQPQMEFKCDCKEGFYVRIFCNLDGVWTTKY